ncbi:MAG: hypothetical protein IPJ37_06740 [Bacteroidales bacterium]|nr:hypothetical protein [Bacteroidales bacterium]
MKTSFFQIFCVVLLSMVSTFDAKSQNNLSQALASIKEKVKDVQVDKATYKQSIDVMDEKKGKLSFVSVMTDEKGKAISERYEFYLSDIDKNTITRKTSGKKLFISLSINNNQKFIKYFKEEKAESYANNLEILLSGASEAQELTDLFKSTIPLVISGEKEWSTSADALSWLKSNITGINSGPVSYEQSFTFGERKDYLAVFSVKKTDQKNVSSEEKFEFSILDLNRKNLTVKVSGTQLSVSVETRGNDPFIRYSKNNEQQNFRNDFEIIAEDIDQARSIIAAFAAAIDKSKQVIPDFGGLQKSLDFITKNTTELTIDKKTLTQKISFSPGNGTKSTFIHTEPDSKGKTIEERYEFYLSDIDAGNLNFKVSGKKITIVPISKNKAKFIRYYKDNALQDFQNEIGILTTDIETTREMVEALKSAVKSSEIQPVAWKSVGDAMTFLTKTLTGENIGAEIYKLTFSSISAEPLNVRYNVAKTDAKGIKAEQTFEFYPYMLDPGTVKIGAAGKYLNVEASVGAKKPFIKVFKEDKQQAFDDKVEIMAFDARQAQEIAEAIKYLAGNGKPKEKVWSDKQSVIKFITENIGDIKNEGKEVKQKMGLINNDPCRISLTVSSADDKGKTTDEIFEFTLSDMNKITVDLKVSGKNVDVIIPCKNKEKLVKAYKNGEQQAWGSEVKIGMTDIEAARNLAEAFRNAITQCEK